MAKSKQGKRRAKENQVGKLLKQHKDAAAELFHAHDKLKRLKLMAVEDGDSRPYAQEISELGESIQALQKYMADTHAEIMRLNDGKFTQV